MSWAILLRFNGVSARCIVLSVRCPGPLGSCSPVCSLGALGGLRGVLGNLAPVHLCARWLRGVPIAVTSASRLLFTDVLALRSVLRVRYPGLLGSCSEVCPIGLLHCVCVVLGPLAPVH